ncbi:hypothetical protein [Bdellovibrio bacteriovorus]|uniref:hypothetical protein n=1 Tax=Bdellovibrio bacteriovorus TaxID=959 RepID=UPI00059F5C0E|nr:hypothetical protein [Bdellovibrio bacteriovorus]
MLKCLVTMLLVSGFAMSSFAADKKGTKRKVASDEVQCSASPGDGVDVEYVARKIKESESCYDASYIVEGCGVGTSLDNVMVEVAVSVCDKLTGKLSKSDTELKRLMNARCAKVCNPDRDGTMCISRVAYCSLAVSKFLNSVSR